MITTKPRRPALLLLGVPILALGGPDAVTSPEADMLLKPAPVATVSAQAIPVSSTGLFLAPGTIVHSEEPTPTGMIQQSTSVVQLAGDINGWVLFHAISDFDFVNGTLVNTGTQIFSGTIAGSDPVLLHDDEFHFDIDLVTGATTGEIFFSRSGDAPHRGGWFDCDLDLVGTGVTPEGNLTSVSTGTCTPRGNLR
jgi:hypothetical protein